MEVSELIKVTREGRNAIEQSRNKFIKLYRTQRFNDPESINALNKLKININNLLLEFGKKDSDFAKEKLFPEEKTIIEFLYELLKNFEQLNSFQTEIVLLTKSKIKGDVSKFQELWRSIDDNILYLNRVLQTEETKARAYIKIYDSGKSASEECSQPIAKIKITDISPSIILQGETLMVIQCNAPDNRKPGTAKIGHITFGGKRIAIKQAKEFFNSLFNMHGADASSIDIRLIASSVTLTTPEGIISDRKRAVDTSYCVIRGLLSAMSSYKIPPEHFLNLKANGGAPLETDELHDLKMFEQSSAFVEFLKKKYGPGTKEFWMNYEIDKHSTLAKRIGVEDQNKIADRVYQAVFAERIFAEDYHKHHPGKRLVTWIIGHYDSLSPFMKKHVFNLSDLTLYLGIEKCGGLTIICRKNGSMESLFRGKRYTIL
ncbi:hypothetical protein HY837_04025 [archaeon]|nr:hypothetical protein [archaeon]